MPSDLAMWKARALEAEQALVSLTSGGPEFYLPDGDGDRVDVPVCLSYLRVTSRILHSRLIRAMRTQRAGLRRTG